MIMKLGQMTSTKSPGRLRHLLDLLTAAAGDFGDRHRRELRVRLLLVSLTDDQRALIALVRDPARAELIPLRLHGVH
jgi:hypothetical protein